jgi:type I site-specific restriction-modification system R (restriction) subunit
MEEVMEETLQEQIDKLKQDRNLAWQVLSKISSSLKGLQDLLNEVKLQHGMAKIIYEQLDHKLALIDGRMKKIEHPDVVEKKRKMVSEIEKEESSNQLMDRLSPEQVQRLIAKFGGEK